MSPKLATPTPWTTTMRPNTSAPPSKQPRWTPLPKPNQILHTYVVHHAKRRLPRAAASTNAPTPTRVLAGPRQLARTTYQGEEGLTCPARGTPGASMTRSRPVLDMGRPTRSCGPPCRSSRARWAQQSRACEPTLGAAAPPGAVATSRVEARAPRHAAKSTGKRANRALAGRIGSLACARGTTSAVSWPR
jgi:hypothetical protein